MNKKRFFSSAEWEILQYVATHHPVTARAVADHFGATHDWARTTVLTLIERLRTKGYLTRDESAPVYLYSPSAAKGDAMQGLVRDFVETALGGSVSPFFAYLGKEARLTAEERQALKQILRDIEAQEGSGDA